MADEFPRDRLEQQLAALKTERSSFEAHWKECSEFVAPRRGRFLVEDRNKGDKRYSKIINSAATTAHRVARAGMLAGTMSPARPWFSFKTPDEDLMEFQPVKDWIDRLVKQMLDIIAAGNFYGMSATMIGELLQFATGCMMQIEDYEHVARFYTHTVGSYYLAQNDRFEIDTMFRSFQWTVLQVVSKFGLANVSQMTKNLYDRSDYHTWVTINHAIVPNTQRNYKSALSKDKAWKSCYWEAGEPDKRKFLQEKGYDEYPAACPRWDLTGEDIYGTDCPAMTALGDIKGLQVQEKFKAQAIQKMVNPPLRGPASLKNVPIIALPGGVNIYEGNEQQKLEPVYMVNMPLQEVREDNAEITRRIEEAFFNPLFLAITNVEGVQPRNQYDLIQRNEERLLQIGPVLERLHGEFLAPVLDRLFKRMVRVGIVAPPPPEIAGKQLNLTFISTLAMAQRAVSTGGLDRLAGFTINLMAAGFGGAADKFDAEQAIDEYGKALGTPPKVIVPDAIVEQRRAQKAQQAQEERAMAMAQGAAGTAKDLAAAKTDEPSALTEVAKSLGPLMNRG